jgi:hypothetical protein
MTDTERIAYLERQVVGLLELVEILSKRIDRLEFDVVATTALSTCSISSRAWRTLGCWRWQQFGVTRQHRRERPMPKGARPNHL